MTIVIEVVPRLTITSGGSAGRSFEFHGPTPIGRHPSNRISLNDKALSRMHAVIEETWEGVFITDLNSANGTWVNGKQVREKHPIRQGDRIRVGRTEIRFTE